MVAASRRLGGLAEAEPDPRLQLDEPAEDRGEILARDRGDVEV